MDHDIELDMGLPEDESPMFYKKVAFAMAQQVADIILEKQRAPASIEVASAMIPAALARAGLLDADRFELLQQNFPVQARAMPPLFNAIYHEFERELAARGQCLPEDLADAMTQMEEAMCRCIELRERGTPQQRYTAMDRLFTCLRQMHRAAARVDGIDGELPDKPEIPASI